ncbi:transporter [Lipomyces orientalis]|uniref:Transporter n=1 Tax=Lipomyces orientalis TaxID=1233043 RepID=A0ACC3TP12_9ASCO
MSAAAVWTVGLALITDSFPEENIGKLMGVVSSSMGLGVFLGPVLGGVVYDRAGYYAVFGILFGLVGSLVVLVCMLNLTYRKICVDILLRVFMLERKELEKWKQSVDDETGGERDRPCPLVLQLLKSGRMINGLYMGVVIAWILTALEPILPLHVETRFYWNTLGSGLIFLPIALTSLLSPLIVASCMLLPSSMAEISTCVAAAEQKKPGIFGKGGAYGQAFGLFNLAYSAGSVFGPLEAGCVTEAEGWGTATWTLGLISFVSAIPAVLFTGGFLFRERADRTERTQAPTEDFGMTVVVTR